MEKGYIKILPGKVLDLLAIEECDDDSVENI